MYKIDICTPPVLVTAYDITRQTTWHCADENNIIVIILDGKCSFTLDNNAYILKKGNMLLIPSRTEYMRKPVDNSSCSFAYIHFVSSVTTLSKCEYEAALNDLNYFESKELIEEIVLPRVTDISKKYDEILALYNLLKKNFVRADRLSHYAACLFLTEILISAQRCTVSTFTKNLPEKVLSPIVQKSVNYIRKHYEEKISLDELCKESFVTPQHLIRKFKNELNISPIEYINKVKIMHAIDLLRTSNLTIEEIAYKLGFTGASYFGRVFKKYNGNTPGEERDRIINYKNHSETT